MDCNSATAVTTILTWEKSFLLSFTVRRSCSLSCKIWWKSVHLCCLPILHLLPTLHAQRRRRLTRPYLLGFNEYASQQSSRKYYQLQSKGRGSANTSSRENEISRKWDAKNANSEQVQFRSDMKAAAKVKSKRRRDAAAGRRLPVHSLKFLFLMLFASFLPSSWSSFFLSE